MAGLYVHIPYCHSKCAYCDFYSAPLRADAVERLIPLLVRELEMRRDEVAEPLRTVYIGGGTPSIVPESSLSVLVDAIGRNTTDIIEFTIEANPEDVTAKRVAAWHSMGINRVSMGVQSLIDSELQAIGRRHSASEALRAVEVLRSRFDNVSLDLIYGLPWQTPRTWQQSLETVMRLRPEHFSAYLLSYEPGTRLTALLRAGKLVETPEDWIEEMYSILCRATADAGYEHYEISNFALPSRRAMHNSSYWNGTPYLGIGPAAHSFDGTTRRVNPSDTRLYSRHIDAGETAYEIDDETDDNRYNDLLITALRTAEGLDLGALPEHRLRQLYRNLRHVNPAHYTITNGWLRILPAHWLVADDILRCLIV